MTLADLPVPRVAVAGCGYWGKNLVRNFAELGALAAVCDPDAAFAADFTKKFNVPALRFDELCAAGDIDGVVIAAPAELHAGLATQALRAGKHVFVEKPLALTDREAEAVTREAAAAGRILMVGHLMQYHPAFQKLRDMIEGGDLGRLQYLYSNRLNLGKIRREENILWSFAPHDISMILALVGAEPERVSAVGGTFLHQQIADVTTTHMAFPNGVQAHVFVSWLHPFKEQKLVVVGDRAMAVFNDGEPWDSKLVVYPHRINWKNGVPTPEKADGVPVPLPADEPLKRECLHFLDCIRTNTAPRTDGAEAVRVLRVLAQAEASMAGDAQPAITRPGIHETAVVDEPCEIGAGTRVWHFSHVLKGSRIGANCTLGQNVSIGPDVTIGDNCKIQNNVSVYKGVTLEQGVFCGPSCVFTNVMTPRAEVDRATEFSPTLVRRGASIGANATIVCGVTLGKYSMIGAGSVVTKDVPDFALVAGVPARRIGWVSRVGERLDASLTCPRSGEHYRQVGPNALEEILDR